MADRIVKRPNVAQRILDLVPPRVAQHIPALRLRRRDVVGSLELDHSTQIFPLFDPITEEHIGYKPRWEVHEDGDWHKGLQVHIIRVHPEDPNTFQILVQRRSETVDINKGKIDQSLATQMLDKDQLDEGVTLRRGLETELAVTSYRSMRVDVGGLRIVKIYKEYPTKYNRELVALHLVVVDDETQIQTVSDKVSDIYWMDWDDFVTATQEHEEDFTKTPQLYIKHDDLRTYIEDLSYQLLKIPHEARTQDLSQTFFAYVDAEDDGRQFYVFSSREDMEARQSVFDVRR